MEKHSVWKHECAHTQKFQKKCNIMWFKSVHILGLIMCNIAWFMSENMWKCQTCESFGCIEKKTKPIVPDLQPTPLEAKAIRRSAYTSVFVKQITIERRRTLNNVDTIALQNTTGPRGRAAGQKTNVTNALKGRTDFRLQRLGESHECGANPSAMHLP